MIFYPGTDQIDQPKYKCNVTLEFIRTISKSLQFEIQKYLYSQWEHIQPKLIFKSKQTFLWETLFLIFIYVLIANDSVLSFNGLSRSKLSNFIYRDKYNSYFLLHFNYKIVLQDSRIFRKQDVQAAKAACTDAV